MKPKDIKFKPTDFKWLWNFQGSYFMGLEVCKRISARANAVLKEKLGREEPVAKRKKKKSKLKKGKAVLKAKTKKYKKTKKLK